jgi:hypothetical protein
MAEVNSSLQEFLHRNIRQKSSSPFGPLMIRPLACPERMRSLTADSWKLSLRELEPLARAFLPVLLAFFGARISSKETALTQTRAEFRIEHD